jgi:hypothetical protein
MMSQGNPQQMQRDTGVDDKGDRLRRKMVRVTVNLPAELADGMRDAVYWTPGLTLAWFIAAAIRTSLTELESFNRAPFPKRARPLRPGRPRLTSLLPKGAVVPLGRFYRSSDDSLSGG